MAKKAAAAIDPARCAAGRPDVRPFVVTWDATDQSSFASHAQDSIVLVRVSGCELEVLDQCTIPGEYRLRETEGNMQSLSVDSADQLYAKLPLGVAALSGTLEQSGAVQVKYFVRGTRAATAPALFRSQLPAGCESATHFVLNYAAGAYEVGTTSASGASAEASAFGAAAGAGTKSQTSVSYRGGDIAACDKKEHCTAPIRLRLMPIAEGAPPADVAPAAQLAITKPVAPAAPATVPENDRGALLKASQKLIQQAAVACLDEYPPEDWSAVPDGQMRVKVQVAFGTDGSVINVKLDPQGLKPEAVGCVWDAARSGRYFATGDPHAIGAMASFTLGAKAPVCMTGTRATGWACRPAQGAACPQGTETAQDGSCTCPGNAAVTPEGTCPRGT
jgi:hypothetical protein